MKRSSHITVGVATAYLLGLPILPAMVGATLPDIDLYLKECRLRWKLLCNHRGITHHALLGLVLGFLIPLAGNPFLKSFLVGYLSHLFADLLTPKGIPFWRYGDRISLSLVRTGSFGEYILVGIYALTSFGVLLFKDPMSLIPADALFLLKSLWKF